MSPQINRQFIMKLARILLVFTFTISIFYPGSTDIALSQEPLNPHFEARPLEDYIDGWDWPTDVVVTLTIDDPSNGPGIDFSETKSVGEEEWDPHYIGFYFQEEFDLQPGHIVTLSDGVTTKEHIVTSLTVTGYDLEADHVYGTTESGARVDLWICWDEGCANRHETADAAGNWTADFSIPGDEGDEGDTYDIVPGTHVDLAQRDEDGDSTFIGWWVPNPRLRVNLDSDQVDGWDWLPNATVNLSINDPGNGPGVDYSDSTTTDEWGNFNFSDLSGVFDIQPGFEVTVTDGVSTKEHVVIDLAISDIDPVTDTIIGIGNPNDHVRVWFHWGCDTDLYVATDESGNWTVDFSGICDLIPGSDGAVEQIDQDDDSTYIDWRVLNPHFEARPLEDYIDGWEWPTDAVVTMTIDDPSNGPGIDYSDIKPVGEEEWDPNFVGFYFQEEFDLQPGHIVTLDDGVTTKVHTVTSLTVTGYDLDADHVYGTADPGTKVDFWICWEEDCAIRHETTDGAGNWLADFSLPGEEEDEREIFDLQPGVNGGADQRDEDYDRTFIGWWVPNPQFHVDASDDSVWGGEWEPNSTVTVEVHGVVTEVPTDEGGDFGMGTGEDIMPGDTVMVTQGAVLKSHVVTELAITVVDPDTDMVSGTAAQGSELYVWVRDVGNVVRHEIVAGDGIWSADFGIPGDEPGEEGTTDLVPGSNGASDQCDSDNDCTHAGWRIPNPQFWVDPSSDSVWGEEWTPHGQVTVTVNTTEVPGSPFGLDENGNFGTDLSVDLQANDEMVVTDVDDPTISKDHTITSLTIDGVDAAANTIWGTAAVGSDVWVDIHGEGNVGRIVTATDGTWLVDFDDPGDGGGTFDLEPGSDGYAQQCDIDNDCTWIDWQIPDPRFWVYASRDHVSGSDWEPNSLATVELHGISTDVLTDEGGYFDLNTGEDIVPGDTVTVSQGAVSKSHVVTDLAITVVDPDTDIVSGIAAPGSELFVWVHYTDVWRHETATPEGTWSADFSTPGDEPGEEGTTDLVPGSDGNSDQCDSDNDCTFAWWGIPNPQFWVDPSSDNIGGDEWTPNGQVTVTVNTTEVPGSPFGLDENGNFGTGLSVDLQANDEVVVTDVADPTISKDHTITSLTIEGMDDATNTVWGTAAVSSDVWVDVHDEGNVGRTVTATDGTWLVDFDDPGDGGGTFDLEAGSNGYANQCDIDNDCTWIDWRIPNPRFTVDAYADNVWGVEWKPDSSVTVEVHGVATDVPTDEWGEFGVGTGEDIVPGDTVTVTQGVVSKSLVVMALAVMMVDADTDTVSGIGEPDDQVHIYLHEGCENELDVPTDSLGNWIADFAGLCDLIPGTEGSADQTDLDGDSTYIDWHVPYPRFGVQTHFDYIEGWDWPEGEDVTLTIDDLNTPESPDYTDVQTPYFPDWDPNQTIVEFNFWDFFDLQPGHFVTLENGTTTREHIATSLEITDFDLENDIVIGIGDPGIQVEVWTCWDDGCASRCEIPDGSGNWSANFSIPGEDDDEQVTIDILPGMGFDAEQLDEDGDKTMTWKNVSNPHFLVHLTEGEVQGFEWPLGESVILTIDDPATPEVPDYEDTQTVVIADWDPEETFVPFRYQDILEVAEGFVVTMTDGATFKEHTVTSLTLESVDMDTDLISGTAEPDSEVWVYACDDFTCASRREVADESGNWSADFSVPGDENDEQEIFDIRPGTGGDAVQNDQDGDGTQVGWWITDPPTCNPGESLTGNVYQDDGATPFHEATIYFEYYHSGEQLFQVTTGEDGSYSCALPEGEYRLWAIGPDQSREYYPETIYENASLIKIRPGLPISGINFVLDTPWPIFDHLTFNISDPIVGEPAVRQAIAYGTNRAEIIAVTFPTSPVWDTYLPPNHWAYAQNNVPQYDFDPQLAGEILTMAGWVDEDGDGVREKNGVGLHIEYVTVDQSLRATIYEVFAANMADIGIEIEVIALPFPWERIFEEHNFGIAQFAWGIDINDEMSGSSIWHFYESESDQNPGFYSNPIADQLLEDVVAVRTRDEKKIYLEPHQALVMSDLAVLPLLERVIDSDGDGVGDHYDFCPDEDASGYDADNDGCLDTPEMLLQILKEIQEDQVAKVIKNSLMVKVSNAVKSLDKGNDRAAIGELNAFINQVNALQGIHISDGAAELLIANARNIIMQI